MLVLNGSKPDVRKLGKVHCRAKPILEKTRIIQDLSQTGKNVQEETHKGKHGNDLS